MSDLVVRAYNVGFGDAILVSVPEATGGGGEKTRHLLIDVGNLLAGEGNEDDGLRDRGAGHRGAHRRDRRPLRDDARTPRPRPGAVGREAGWGRPRSRGTRGSPPPLTPTTTRPTPKRRRGSVSLELALEDAHRVVQAAPDPWLEMMVRNNSTMLPPGALGLRTSDYVDHLRGIAPADKTYYVDRTTTDLDELHPFGEATLRILAPEADTSSYYPRQRSRPTLTAAVPVGVASGAAREAAPGLSVPPVGVEPGAFFDLQASRRRGTRRQVLEIDKANNNTSVVVELRWRGWPSALRR